MIDSGADSSTYRLPTTSRPRRYEIRLAPDLEAATFEGTERIEIAVVEETTTIVLNAAEIVITAASLRPGWGTDVSELAPGVALSWDVDETSEMVVFTSPSSLDLGEYSLELAFSGILNDQLRGFYRSKFTDDEGVERFIATTQFEETDARRAFPCYDEPDAKAIFSVTLDAPPGLLAVSNAPEISTTALPDGSHRVVFADTMVMSTYLVAFVVGPLEATPPRDAAGIPIRVIHVPGKSHLTEPALECAAHALGFFAEYFDIAYPGDKLDLVAIPDFAAGAMENLGCVTFREAILLADPENSSRSELERLAEVVEHEIAHMWFGDLVTMRWWLLSGQVRRARRRWAPRDPADRVPRPPPRRSRRDVRRPHLREGGERPVDARAVPRTGAVPRRRAPVLEGPRLLEHRDDRPLGRDRAGRLR
jgi:puromycin-sensitive aminopeptidase